ncbi:hypothetical protein BDY21DRAFT_151020 [Lineolata rhizophorae]|uniref:BTB domain-containing protein n=1 Tax=Lineolata rhizophorae TaxID=578093 RepID=A0A6A6NMU6_9PEZI|nr:hypothetical protein BDY21DRAFT_151020 [Lineolata rhizophorae]
MSSKLWALFLFDDVDAFQRLLETASYNARQGGGGAQRGNNAGGAGAGVAGGGSAGGATVVSAAAAATAVGSSAAAQPGSFGAHAIGSPGSLGTSPTLVAKSRRSGAGGGAHGGGWTVSGGAGASTAAGGLVLTRADVNKRDAVGKTLLHHVASSTSTTAVGFARALVQHPLIDLYVQDYENGWTALHRAFYFGNISIARLILERDRLDVRQGGKQRAGGLIKIKDSDGNGPLDLYDWTLDPLNNDAESSQQYMRSSSPNDDSDEEDPLRGDFNGEHPSKINEVYTFGSNKNITLGFGDEDDRQFPERVNLRRPDHLQQRFHRNSDVPVPEQPTVTRNLPLIVKDVQMSKLHSAILTADARSNLYVCGHGKGGRLGTGSENTRFNFVCVDGGALAEKRVDAVALGQNHTLALSSHSLFSWGSNAHGQLGYTLPETAHRGEDPIQLLPRQVFGPLKKELVVGVAASRIHSVVHTATSLYTFGRNEGQLGIVDSDSRSLEIQVVPRKVAASLFHSPIHSVAAIDRATVCLLQNHDVYVFANFGYAKVNFLTAADSFANYFFGPLAGSIRDVMFSPNHISKITSGGDTICALSSRGHVYAVTVNQRTDSAGDASAASTTNPSKIKGALSYPQSIWTPIKNYMAARDVAVDQDGSIILTTAAGSVWRRVKRAKIKDASASNTAQYKAKNYKFSRVPTLTGIAAVRASGYGAYAAVREDSDIMRAHIQVRPQSIWRDLFPLLPFAGIAPPEERSELSEDDPSGGFAAMAEALYQRIRKSAGGWQEDVKKAVERRLEEDGATYDMTVCTTSSDVRIPINAFMLSGRSRVFRAGLHKVRTEGRPFIILDVLTLELDGGMGRPTLVFQGADFLTVLNFVLYLYSDKVLALWNSAETRLRDSFRQTKGELLKISSKLDMAVLESSVRRFTPERNFSLPNDMEAALNDPTFFEDGDVVLHLADDEVRVHSALLCQRCPFFERLFKGGAGGMWLSGRRGRYLSSAPAEPIAIDMDNFDSETFQFALRHIYADAGETLFDEVVCGDLDELFELILDVIEIANFLMIDRLSEVCQKVIGKFIDIRNVGRCLNAISPYSIDLFKKAGLEYMCHNMEAVLQNGYLVP